MTNSGQFIIIIYSNNIPNIVRYHGYVEKTFYIFLNFISRLFTDYTFLFTDVLHVVEIIQPITSYLLTYQHVVGELLCNSSLYLPCEEEV